MKLPQISYDVGKSQSEIVAMRGINYSDQIQDGDLRELGKAMTAALNGRGGGKPNFQQGNVAASRAEIEAFFASRGI